MALATATITFNLNDWIADGLDARRTRGYITTNVENGRVIDTGSKQIRIDDAKVTINDDGTGSVVVWVPGPGANPASWQTTFHFDVPRKGRRDRAVLTFGPYTITASADLADLEDEQAVPPEYAGELVAQLEGIRDDTVAISGISTTDDAVEALVKNTGGAGPKTSAALTASIDARATNPTSAGVAFADARGFARQRQGAPTQGRHLTLTSEKLRGGNIAPKDSHYETGFTWANLFAEWDWNGWVKMQVDLARAAGLNSIRLIGDMAGVIAGRFTLDTYLARWTQLLDYCAANKMLVYVTGGDPLHNAGGTVTQMRDVLVALAKLAARYTNVVGMDVLNEVEGWVTPIGRPEMNTRIATFSAAIRAAAPDLRITYSLYANTQASMNFSANQLVVDNDANVDFWDFHLYGFNPTVASLDTYFANSKKPVILGEYGIKADQTDAASVAFFAAAQLLLDRPDVAGGLVWTIVDSSTDNPSQDFGIYTKAGTARTARVTAIKKHPASYLDLLDARRPTVGSVRSTGNLTVPASATTIPGASLSITPSRDCTMIVTAVIDFSVAVGAELLAGELRVNGTTQPGIMPLQLSGAGRASATQTWSIPLTAGTAYTIALLASRLSGSSAAHVANFPHSGFTYAIYPA